MHGVYCRTGARPVGFQGSTREWYRRRWKRGRGVKNDGDFADCEKKSNEKVLRENKLGTTRVQERKTMDSGVI